ncbi:MAG: putative secreted protein [Herbinix sp.]|jgi:hypothetical protein|nr:putative secreted protein [Herbinix sp.]
MKKRIFYILLFITVLFCIGCKKKDGGYNGDVIEEIDPQITVTNTPQPTQSSIPDNNTSHDGEMRSYLTGLWVPIEIGTKRPYAIQFNNIKIVSNQWGIGQADILYEAIVEGGITRLLGIFENLTGDRIGSVRSSRHYYVSFADEYDAIYIHYGKTKYAVAKMEELGIDHMDGNGSLDTVVFYRDNSMKAPHNAFTSIEGIQAGIKKMGFETEYASDYKPHYSFYENDTDLNSTIGVNKITLDYSNYNSPYLEYNSDEKLYYRFQYGEKHIDSNTKEQLTFKNIIVQFVKEWDIDKNDYQTMDIEDATGDGYYITNGKLINITWKKNEKNRWMRYYDESGAELTINPGKTFISIFPKDRTEDVEITQ